MSDSALDQRLQDLAAKTGNRIAYILDRIDGTLVTTAKDNLVDAINEVAGLVSTGGGGGGVALPISLTDTTDSGTRVAFTPAERTKLAGVATGATANASDATLRDRSTHTGTQSLDTTTDSATRLALTAAERSKLTGIATGATANSSDATLLARANHTGTQSMDTVVDSATRVAFLPAERTKLTGIAAGATVNDTDANLKARANHTGTQSLDTTVDSATRLAMTAAERTKLTGVAAGATANSSDATLLARANHTGTQAASTITGLAAVATSGSATDLATGTIPAACMPALTGDVTSAAGTVSTTLATVNANVGSFGSSTLIPVVTVDAKGRVTAISTVAAAGGGGGGAINEAGPYIATGSTQTLALGVTPPNKASVFMFVNGLRQWDFTIAGSDASTTQVAGDEINFTIFNGTAGSGAALDPNLTAPVLTLAVGQTTYPPQFDVALDDTAVVGDTIKLEWSNKAGTLIGTASNTIDASEATAKAATFAGLSAIASGTYRYRSRIERGSASFSAWSATLIHGPDDMEPLLTAPTAIMVSASSGTVGGTTDTAEGTMYFVVTATNTPPSVAQVKAGQNSAGTLQAAGQRTSVAVTSAGAKTFTATGLTAATAYYGWIVHEDVAANASAVLAAGTFTTDVAASFSMTETAAPAKQNIAFGSSTATFAAQALGAAATSRKILVEIECDTGGTNLTSVTVAGIAATLVTRNNLIHMYEAAVPTGTTGAVVVTSPASIDKIGIRVLRIVGANTGPTVHTPLTWGFNNSPWNIAVTTPSGGATAIFGATDLTSGTASWSNATGSSQDATFGRTIFSGIRGTAGAATVAVTGFGNQNSGLIAASYGP